MVVNEGEEQAGEQGPTMMKELPAGQQASTEQEADLVEENIVDMATAVATEMEEKRRREEWDKMEVEALKKKAIKIQKEADDLQQEAERSELSLDELTTLRQLEARLGHSLGQQTEGPMIGAADGGDYNQRQVNTLKKNPLMNFSIL